MAEINLSRERRRRLDEFVAQFRVKPGSHVTLAKDFDPAMQKALPADKMQSLWETVTKQAGPFGKTLGTRTEKRGPPALLSAGAGRNTKVLSLVPSRIGTIVWKQRAPLVGSMIVSIAQSNVRSRP